MRIAHLSDLHFAKLCLNPFRLSIKRTAGLLNWFFLRRRTFNHTRLDSLPALFQELGVETIVVTGDFATTSLMEEFQAASAFIKKFSQKKLYLPGNHDHYTKKSYLKKHFYQFFTNQRISIEHPAEFFSLKDHGVEAHFLSSWGGWCIALDTAKPNGLSSSNGHFEERVEKNLKELLLLLPQDINILLLNHFPFFQNDASTHILLGGERLKTILENDSRIKLYLHGHTHRHTLANLQGASLPLLSDAGCAVQQDQSSWNLLDLDSTGCKVTAYLWTNESWQPFRTETALWSR